jgi:hypothetical protein
MHTVEPVLVLRSVGCRGILRRSCCGESAETAGCTSIRHREAANDGHADSEGLGRLVGA